MNNFLIFKIGEHGTVITSRDNKIEVDDYFIASLEHDPTHVTKCVSMDKTKEYPLNDSYKLYCYPDAKYGVFKVLAAKPELPGLTNPPELIPYLSGEKQLTIDVDKINLLAHTYVTSTNPSPEEWIADQNLNEKEANLFIDLILALRSQEPERFKVQPERNYEMYYMLCGGDPINNNWAFAEVETFDTYKEAYLYYLASYKHRCKNDGYDEKWHNTKMYIQLVSKQIVNFPIL